MERALDVRALAMQMYLAFKARSCAGPPARSPMPVSGPRRSTGSRPSSPPPRHRRAGDASSTTSARSARRVWP